MKKFFFLFTMLTVFALSSVADTWTVAGSNTALFGTSWDPSNTANDMTLENGLYTWTKSGVSLDAQFMFKVCKDHGWGTAYPASDYVQAVSEPASYDVTITFNESTQAVNCTLTKVGSAEEVEHTFSVAGTPIALFDTEWDVSNTDNDMTLADGVYTWSKSDVALSASTTIEFKCVRDHAWGVAYPTSNYTTTVADAGTYDVVITLDATTFAVNCTVTAKSVTPAEPWATIYIDQTSASGNIYAWDSTGNYGNWPGNAISSLGTAEKDGTTYYVFNFTHSGADTPKVVFNNNDGQTEDIAVADGDVLKYNGGTAYEFVTDEPVVVEPYATIYIDNINSTDGYLHAWDSAGDYTTWPGILLSTLETAEKDGNTYYKYEFTHDGGTSPSILFHDKGAQTANISVADGDVLKYLGGDSYVHNGTTYPLQTVVSAVRLEGSIVDEIGADWAETHDTYAFTKAAEGASWSLAGQRLEAGYEFKMVVTETTGDESADKWYGCTAEGVSGDYWINASTLGSEITVGEGGVNIYIEKGGEYTFNWDGASTLVVTGTIDADPVIEPEFHLLGSFGEGDWEASEDNLMTQNGNVWTATVSAVNGDTFKFYDAANDAWYGGLTADETYGIHAGWCTDVPTATDGNANFALSMLEDAELTITLTQGEQGGYSFSVAGIPSLENGYYLVGSFNEWKPVTGAVAFSEGVATAALEAAAQFKVLEAVDNELTWYGGDTEGNGDTYELKATWPSAALTAGDAGSNFIINTAGEYTFTIEGSQLTVSGWDGCTLAEALAGNNAPISDELTVVRVKNGSAYVTDGNDNWLRVEAGNVSSLTPGCVINGYQLSGVTTPAINPTVTFDGDLEFTAGENVPALAEIDLQAGIDKMPKPAQVVKITGYYRIEEGEAVLSAYAGNVKGNTIAVADAGSMTEGVQYTVEVAVALKEAWEAEGGTVTDVETNLGDDTITIGGGGSGSDKPRAPRKVKASDKDALKNITVSLVGDPVPTGVSDITVDADVVSVKYVNVAGQVSAQPFDGINVVVTTYVDGTTKAVKVVK